MSTFTDYQVADMSLAAWGRKEISIAEIIRLMDGPLAPVGSVSKFFYDESPIEQSEKFIILLREIRDYISDKLEKTTFADLL